METIDYVANVADQFEDMDFPSQTSFNMTAVVLFDRAWALAANEVLGEKKAYEVTERAWNIIGEYTVELIQAMMGLSEVSDFSHIKAILKGGYRAWMIPIRINKENDEIFEYECLACPFPSYGIARFGVKEGDHSCQVLKAMTPAWIDGIVAKAGLTGKIERSIDSGICCGDGTCKVRVKKVG